MNEKKNQDANVHTRICLFGLRVVGKRNNRWQLRNGSGDILLAECAIPGDADYVRQEIESLGHRLEKLLELPSKERPKDYGSDKRIAKTGNERNRIYLFGLRVINKGIDGWWVVHGTDNAILAECAAPEDAEYVKEGIEKTAMRIERSLLE